ncbi:MAG: TSUP family transporter [Syntrophaceae bacterium]|nr:TSUP family transporter [Syntrophaceae bacterium]
MIKKKYLPYYIFAAVSVFWLICLPFFEADFINHYFFMPFLGVVAATVANVTPAAAGIVYFPVMTRIHIDPAQVVMYTLMIQSFGMSLGSIKWFIVDRTLFMKNVLVVSITGGTIGIALAIFFFPLNDARQLRIIFDYFTYLITILVFIRLFLQKAKGGVDFKLNMLSFFILFSFSIIGGIISGWIGFGLDTIFYFTLTFFYRVNAAAAIVTSIVLMAVVSIIGTIFSSFLYALPKTLWFSALPGVAIGGLFVATFLAVNARWWKILLFFIYFFCVQIFLGYIYEPEQLFAYLLSLLKINLIIAYLVIVDVVVFHVSHNAVRNKN